MRWRLEHKTFAPVQLKAFASVRLGQRVNPRGHVRPRKPSCHELLHFALRLAGRRFEELEVIFWCQVLAQELQRREVDRAGREHRMQNGESPRKACRKNSPKSFSLTEPELLHAELEHRRKTGAKMQPPVFDFAEVRDELRRDFSA